MGLVRVFLGGMFPYFNVIWQLFSESVCCTLSLRLQGSNLCFGVSLAFVELVWCGAKVCAELICTLNSEPMCWDVILCAVRGICIWDGSLHLHCRVFLRVVMHVCTLLGQIFAPWVKRVNCGMVLQIVGWMVSCHAIPHLAGRGG